MLKLFSALGRTLALTLVVSGAAVQATSLTAPRSSSSLPLKSVALRVQSGDSLWTVARAHGMTLAQIKKLNGLQSDEVQIGQKLKIWVRLKSTRSSAAVAPRVKTLHARALAKLSPRAQHLLKIRFTRYLAQKRRLAQKRQALEARYAKQARYEKYLALISHKRRVLQARYSRQAKFERYQAVQAQQRRVLQARYNRQAKFERYQMLQAQQRRTLQARYAKQAKFEKYQAQLQAQRTAALKRQVASRNSRNRYNGSSWVASSGSRSVVRKTSFGGSRLSWPVRNFHLTSQFGARDIWIEGSNFHTGIDLAAASGTPIYAASSGTVTQSGQGAYGVGVFVNVGNMDLIYGHMSRTAVGVGQYVNRGDLLGYMGCTGHCTGPHLHFEVRIDGQPRDPIGFMG